MVRSKREKPRTARGLLADFERTLRDRDHFAVGRYRPAARGAVDWRRNLHVAEDARRHNPRFEPLWCYGRDGQTIVAFGFPELRKLWLSNHATAVLDINPSSVVYLINACTQAFLAAQKVEATLLD